MARFEYVKARREDVAEIPVKYEKPVRLGAKLFAKVNVAVYKMSGGRLMNKGLANKPICLVTMTGRKTGKKREIPLMHVPHGEQKILVASLGGISKNPVWYYNLKATPDITITADGVTRAYRAREVGPAEKASLWSVIVDAYPPYDEYQARTDRDIPVFVCDPVG
ncbi:MAG: nitroreductase family deazaflavin-dependent oxidoreductase [Myxococcales bacterium]|nr:nitroreductase family deazaflavin-dependent oxidoreductase [Myxococcales bacterium]MDH3843480.1 nitroreductase family deazaflavin-dependent oxidoreductase [Myxococcales bacterium]